MTMPHDYLEFETNPNPYQNNYSKGKTDQHNNVDSWYLWTGLNLRNDNKVGDDFNYGDVPFGNFLSNKFEVITSVMVEPRIFYDADGWYCAAPWVALNMEGEREAEPIYMQSYIGNDNYDPTGGLYNTDYTDSYAGRFYTKYAAGGGGYSKGFHDPDVATVVGIEMTLREAYEATNLPFFHVRFAVDGNSYSIYINAFEVQHEDNAFYSGAYEGGKYFINNMALHGVNYGKKDGTAGTSAEDYDPYRLTYLNPIVREIV